MGEERYKELIDTVTDLEEGEHLLIPYSDNVYYATKTDGKILWASLDLESSENGSNAVDSFVFVEL